MALMIDYSKFNPLRRPDWRYERVLSIIDRPDGNPGRTTTRDDTWVKEFRDFFLRYRAPTVAGNVEARNRLANKYPGPYWALQMYEHREDIARYTTAIIEARLLARQTVDAVAAEVETLPEVIAWYEAMYFNVIDRLNAHDWICAQVLMPAVAREAGLVSDGTPDHGGGRVLISRPFFDVTLKMFAYYCGPKVIEFLLTGFKRDDLCSVQEDVTNYMERLMVQRLRFQGALAATKLEVSRYNVMELFQVNARFMELAKNARSPAALADQSRQVAAAFLKEMPWTVGDTGAERVAGTVLAKYDYAAAELRDNEVLLVAGGDRADTIEGVELLKLPPPRQKNKQEAAHADAQQGR